MSSKDKTPTSEWSEATEAAKARIRKFLWHEGSALRFPVEAGYVTADEAVAVVVAAFREVLAAAPESVLLAGLEEGGPSPEERAAALAEAKLQGALERAKGSALVTSPKRALRADGEGAGGGSDADATAASSIARPWLRVVPDEDAPADDTSQEDPQ